MLERRLPVELIGWQAMVDDAMRAGFEAARRARYRVADYLVPQAGNERVPGLDASTRPEQAAAARRACLLGEAAMTGQFNLLTGNNAQAGFLVLMPVYRGGAATGGDRCGSAAGYTQGALSPQGCELRRLEAEEPGVTSVRRASDGSIYLE